MRSEQAFGPEHRGPVRHIRRRLNEADIAKLHRLLSRGLADLTVDVVGLTDAVTGTGLPARPGSGA